MEMCRRMRSKNGGLRNTPGMAFQIRPYIGFPVVNENIASMTVIPNRD